MTDSAIYTTATRPAYSVTAAPPRQPTESEALRLLLVEMRRAAITTLKAIDSYLAVIDRTSEQA